MGSPVDGQSGWPLLGSLSTLGGGVSGGASWWCITIWWNCSHQSSLSWLSEWVMFSHVRHDQLHRELILIKFCFLAPARLIQGGEGKPEGDYDKTKIWICGFHPKRSVLAWLITGIVMLGFRGMVICRLQSACLSVIDFHCYSWQCWHDFDMAGSGVWSCQFLRELHEDDPSALLAHWSSPLSAIAC